MSNSWSNARFSDGEDEYHNRNNFHNNGRNNSMPRSRSFNIERKDHFGNKRFGKGMNFSSGPLRKEPVVGVKMDIQITPTASPEEEKKFFKDNLIKIIGENCPPAALTFEELNLPGSIMKQIQQNQWVRPSPIQSISMPVAFAGRDLIGIAKTGSGKTGAFIIPAMVHIKRQPPMQRGDGPIALVLSPTRELAQQISEVASSFAAGIGCNECCIFGGAGRGAQISQLRRSPALVIATPGRLIDYMEQGIITTERINFLVLDEADRMLDMGFEPQIRQIIENISEDRQTMMFSATWPKEIRQLAKDFLNNPIHMVIGSNELTTNSAITQIIEKVEEFEKMNKIIEFLKDKTDKKVIVFTKTKRSADNLSDALDSRGIPSMSIHGDKPQNEREYILHKYKECKAGALVATDVAARGLDVSDIDIVVNFDFPGDIESYIHRIGRTARGSNNGMALTFFTDENKNMSRKLAKVLTQSGQTVPDWLQELAKQTPRGASRGSFRGGRQFGHNNGRRNNFFFSSSKKY
ncbi:DEAD/DEAH box helicase family protein [Histomonas meleagridis]|uniref:DEAD/DEAH box helicase family protein n=1 Tax=Histomonas meleagridis TaxID=135588 RepID=UPI00355A8ED9|nr:DEAD/DEAH box helicase family protein [Histomonas meleagridis]KAH0798083.1 DEAD/DEAH box helicase family protein [Histomonas meleagridis]